ncbi:glycosyltransferase [Pseudodesulfovibrio sp. zrk46]|uniref:glycosyltransferase n=1 Tax=Pseudodesulfovibrio sp. zrk46 TaxID=2725288 RepID=UPI001449F1A0|nr:glycosyltransferase [Pseudodesulfovibrio sp. zrk46]QJB56593.1 glycosyltransferase [Pseudodesulfovibrio sp. zrk46]
MKVLFLIRSLDPGGAELQLVTLANGLAGSGHDVSVAVFYPGGELESKLEGVSLHSLNKGGRWDLIPFLLRLKRLVNTLGPDVLHSFLGTANAFGALLRPFLPGVKVVWGVRSAEMNLENYGWVHRAHYKAECLLSRFASKIIANSEAGLEYAVKSGFPRGRCVFIPNGIDVESFRPMPEEGKALRAEWGVSDDELLVGIVARIDPIKNYDMFLRAAARASESLPKLRFVCVGSGGNSEYAATLLATSRELGLEQSLIWAGHIGDMPSVYSALDVTCLTSSGEGFPNALCESMACGTVCISTDVGDAAQIVGEIGQVVPSGQPVALGEALCSLLRQPRERLAELGRASRMRIKEKYGVSLMVQRTESVLHEVLGGPDETK